MKKWHCYSRGIAAAPVTTSGPSSRVTTANGGYNIVTSMNGNSYIVDGNGAVKQGNNLVTGGIIMGGSASGWIVSHPGETVQTSTNGNHTHGGEVDPDGEHTHTVTIPPHTHDIHSHSHFIDHEHIVVLPEHTHEMDHTHVIPSHTHEIEYGIFHGPTPTEVTVKVDGNIIPGLGTSVDGLDITPYMSKDESGKIERGKWHTVEIIPNTLGRIVASVVIQLFVQSRGGGNY